MNINISFPAYHMINIQMKYNKKDIRSYSKTDGKMKYRIAAS